MLRRNVRKLKLAKRGNIVGNKYVNNVRIADDIVLLNDEKSAAYATGSTSKIMIKHKAEMSINNTKVMLNNRFKIHSNES